jgi:glucose/arabinose dehydrogenase
LPCAAQTVRDTSLQVREVVGGLSSPTGMAFIGANDILVLQKGDGRVRRVQNGVLQAGAVLDLAVDSASERGLLGIALHPSFPSTPWVYLYFTESSNGSDTNGAVTPAAHRVYRYIWNGSALVTPALVTTLPVTPGPNHNGGVIAFGPDGKLYIIIGDLNRNGRLQNIATGAAADDSSVILRLNADGSIPPDNPFASQGGALAKYYAYGIRNSFGMAFDPVTGRLWDTENGPSSYDEINLVRSGFNSGWLQIMGPDARDAQSVSDLYQVTGSQYSDPEFSWLNPVGVTAIAFLNSTQLGAQYQNDVFVGDINNGNLYRFEPNATRDGFVLNGALADLVADDATERDAAVFGSGFGGITDLKVGPDGRLYVLSFSGKIYAISAPSATTFTLNVIKSGTGTGSITSAPAGINCGTDCTEAYASGSVVALTAQPAPGSTFAGWSGACTGAAACSVTMDAAKNVDATFTAGTATTTLSVNPVSIAAGGSVTVSWSNITSPSGTNWIGLYTPGAASQNHGGVWMYVNCTKTAGAAFPSGSCAFPIPSGLNGGSYELRLHASGSWTAIARTPLTVSGGGTGGPTIGVAPTSTAAGTAVTVSWSGIATPTGSNWIGLLKPGALSWEHGGVWMYVNCSKTAGAAFPSGNCTFPIPSGIASGGYELRLHASSSWTPIAKTTLTITGGTGGGATSLSVNPTIIAAGGTVTVNWSGIAAPTGTNWIGFYAPGAASQNHGGLWMYVSCSKTAGAAFPSGSCAFPIPSGIASGSYELRLHASSSWTAIAKTPLQVR